MLPTKLAVVDGVKGGADEDEVDDTASLQLVRFVTLIDGSHIALLPYD
jgi:hypothetical protein